MNRRLRDDPNTTFIAIEANGSLRHLPDVRGAHAVMFECPCGQHQCLVAFEPTIDTEPTTLSGLSRGGGRWKRTGTTLDDLTLTPSIVIGTGPGECWHGFVTNGELTNA
jgi:hypothetical protein